MNRSILEVCEDKRAKKRAISIGPYPWSDNVVTGDDLVHPTDPVPPQEEVRELIRRGRSSSAAAFLPYALRNGTYLSVPRDLKPNMGSVLLPHGEGLESWTLRYHHSLWRSKESQGTAQGPHSTISLHLPALR